MFQYLILKNSTKGCSEKNMSFITCYGKINRGINNISELKTIKNNSDNKKKFPRILSILFQECNSIIVINIKSISKKIKRRALPKKFGEINF